MAHMNRPPVVILTAGQNSRFFPFQNTHKGNLTLLGKPLLQRCIEDLAQHGFTELVVVISPKEKQDGGVLDTIKAAGQLATVHIIEQTVALGMGDAVLAAAPTLAQLESKLNTDQFVVCSPYSLIAGKTAELLVQAGTDAAVGVRTTSEPWLYGIVMVENHRLKGIVEKPAPGTEPSTLKIGSTYLLNQAFLTVLKQAPVAEYNFEMSLHEFAQKHEVAVVELALPELSLKYPWQLFDFQSYLFQNARSWQSPEANVASTVQIDDSQGPVIIEAGATVNDFTRIVGPAYIGKNALVGEFCFVRTSSIEAGARVGAYTEVVRSIVMQKTSIHQSYLADSILGQNCNIGAGLITANLRLDHKTVRVKVKDKQVDTHRRKLGVLIGNAANVGIRANTMPGIVIGANATVFPNQVVYSNLDHETVQK